VPITLSINGKQERLADGTTIAALLAQRQIRPDVVTVEINEQIVDARRYGMTCLKDGDVIEMVYVIGGDRPRGPAARAARSSTGQSRWAR